MSLWRKRQIMDKQKEISDYEKCEMENIKRRARELHAKLLHRQRTDEILASIFDYVLLVAGCFICYNAFGFNGAVGLGMLAIYAKGKE